MLEVAVLMCVCVCVCVCVRKRERELRLLKKSQPCSLIIERPEVYISKFKNNGPVRSSASDSIDISLAESIVDCKVILIFMAFRSTFILKKGDLM
jgi:hypothetical protein